MEETQTWLNEEYVREILKASIADSATNDITIIDYSTNRAVAKGKNYCSTVYRVKIRYKHTTDETRKKNYVIKKLIPEAVSWFGDKETQAYTQVLPKIEEYLNTRLVPTVYKYNVTELVMEDLGDQGFTTSGLKLLDYEHCVAALRALARFHAGSVLMHGKDRKLIEETLGYETFGKSEQSEFFRINISRLADEISTWPESSGYSDGVRSISERTNEYFGTTIKRNALRVLNHGDFWLNNILFDDDDDGKVNRVRIVDFQICRYSPPTCDLQYFIGSSADLDVRRNRQDELLSAYLDTLNGTLDELGLDLSLSKERFEEDMKLDFPMYFLGVTMPLVVLLADPDNDMTFEGIGEEPAPVEACDKFGSLMKSKLFREFFPEVLVDLDERGVFGT